MMEEFILGNSWVLLLITLWTIPWKGIALWKSAHNKQMGWVYCPSDFEYSGYSGNYLYFLFQQKENPVNNK